MAEAAIDTQQPAHEHKPLTLRGAIFLGIGSMVGAGIFALFGQAGAIAGAAVWFSFLVGGIIALLQGYSFAKLGARYPSSGGMIDWIVRGYGSGLFTGGVVVLVYFAVIIVTALVAVSFGNYATSLFLGPDAAQIWVNIFTSAVIVLLTMLNIVGAEAVSKAQTAIVGGVLAFTGGDLENPTKNLPRAMYISLGFTLLLYVALAILLFAWYTLQTAPRTFVILVVIVILAWVVEAIWRGISKRKLEVS